MKIIIDRIVDELAKTDTVAEAYAAWQEIQNSLLNTYQDKPPEPLPLSQQKDFKSIKNMVIKEALNIGNGTITFEPVSGGDETTDFTSDEPPFIDDTGHTPLEPNEDGHAYADWSEQYKQARLYLFGDEDTPPDFEKACDLFLLEADKGNALAMHDLGRMFADGLGREIDIDIAHQWYAKALAAFHVVEEENPKPYTEYRIGKMYNAGLGTEQDYKTAAHWFTPAADDGNKYAQYSLGGLYYKGNGEDTSKNIETNLWWLSLSAEQGNQYAQYTLGKLYLMSKDVEQDKAKALEYFTLSAAQGNIYA